MGSGKPRPRAVRRPSEVRLGFDAFESRSTLADLGSLSRNTTFSDTASAFCCACIHRDLRSTVAQRKQKTGAYSFMNVELPRPFYISSWDKCQTFSFTCCAQLPAGIPVFQKGKEILTFRQREVGTSLLVSGSREPVASKTSMNTSFFSTGVGRSCLASSLPPLKDGQQDFFMGVGSWEMANGRWHIDQ